MSNDLETSINQIVLKDQVYDSVIDQGFKQFDINRINTRNRINSNSLFSYNSSFNTSSNFNTKEFIYYVKRLRHYGNLSLYNLILRINKDRQINLYYCKSLNKENFIPIELNDCDNYSCVLEELNRLINVSFIRDSIEQRKKINTLLCISLILLIFIILWTFITDQNLSLKTASITFFISLLNWIRIRKIQ